MRPKYVLKISQKYAEIYTAFSFDFWEVFKNILGNEQGVFSRHVTSNPLKS
jgi:hypothetical protein